MSLRTCLDCALQYKGQSRFCTPCNVKKWHRQCAAGRAVYKAIMDGQIPPPRTLPCADCGGPAHCYDHRDYDLPLSVAAVCRTCNSKRGFEDKFKAASSSRQ